MPRLGRADYYDEDILAEFYKEFSSGTPLGANQTYEFTLNDLDTRLDLPTTLGDTHVGWLGRMEVYGPDNLYALYVIVDDQEYRQYLYIRVGRPVNALPPRERILPPSPLSWTQDVPRIVTDFGQPPHVVAAQVAAGEAVETALLRMAGIPFIYNVRPVIVAGSSNVVEPVRVVLYGKRYHVQDLPGLASALQNAKQVRYADSRHERLGSRLEFAHNLPQQFTRETWRQLPGGQFQGVPAIWPFWRTSQNAAQTAPNADFAMTEDDQLEGASGNVRQYESLGFRYSIENKALILRGVGARAGLVNGANHNGRHWWIQAGDEELPSGRLPLRYQRNPFHFGSVAPDLPESTGLFRAIPEFEDEKPLIYRENAVFKIRATGAGPIAADDVILHVAGWLVDLGGQVPGARG